MSLRVVAAVAVRDRRVLMARRGPGGPHAGLWEFPGGKVEEGETDALALAREIKEELGVEARVGRLLAVGGDSRVELHCLQVELLGEPEAIEHEELAWVEVARLSGLAMPPADVAAVRALAWILNGTPPSVGSVVDKYLLESRIGSGGMATVYLGRHTKLANRLAAIKILHPHISSEPRNRARFAREAEAIQGLRHENVLELYDYSGVDFEQCWIVTEYVPGLTLQELLTQRGLIPSEVAAMVGLRLARALEYAHSRGVIHRDLKPENVMVRTDGTVKLMDFGIARIIGDSTLTMTGSLVGSPAYMSPEQALERELDPRTDLFSLGVLLYHLVTGRLPFAGSNPSVILRKIIENDRLDILDAQPGMSPRLAGIVERLLQPEVEDRYESAGELADELDALFEEIELDLAGASWGLEAFLRDPQDFEDRLRAYLEHALLECGRVAMARGDHLGAQRLFNRLLVWNPDNPEVLDALEDTRLPELMDPITLDTPPQQERSSWLWAVPLLALLFAAGAWALVGPTEPISQPSGQGMGTATPELPELPAVTDADPLETSEQPADDAEPDPDKGPDTEPSGLRPGPVADGGRIALPGPPDRGLTERRVEEPEPAPAAEPTGTGTLRVVQSTDPPSWAYLQLDGRDAGTLRGPVELEQLPVGEHTLRVRNSYSGEQVFPFVLEVDQTLTIEVDLQPRPLALQFRRSLDAACTLRVDGAARGSLESLDWAWTLESTSGAQEVAVECPEVAPQSWTVERRPGETRRTLPP